MINQKEFETIRNVAREFVNVDKILEIRELTSGHINKTYLIIMPETKYVLQNINTYVFTSPFGIMHNIEEVTNHIRKKIIYEGKDPNRCVLNIVRSRYDQVLCIYNDSYWRCIQFIDNAVSMDTISDPKMFYEIGKAVGDFQNLLNDFHTRVLDETIAHFHDTPYRYIHFQDIVKLNRGSRVNEVVDEINFVHSHQHIMDKITSKLENHLIPRRVTHNDTKPSNIMIDKKTGKALCLIDLDTVMKGSLLYDYGDALRIGASTAEEDEPDLDKVGISLELFSSFTEGFLSQVKSTISLEEVKGLYDGFLLMTFEVGMRFLDDYIDGDRYFRVNYSTHNLVRARNQFKLVTEIEKHEKQLKEIINEKLQKLDYEFTII